MKTLKNKNQLFVILMCAICIISLLTGCGSKTNTEAQDSDTVEDTQQDPAENDDKTDDSTTPSGSESTGDSTTPTEQEGTKEVLLPDDLPMDFVFSSGAGGWGTLVTLNSDGTFTGSFSDSEMGDRTVYYCNFSGNFSDIKKLDDNTYTLTLSELTLEGTKGDERIEDDILYVVSDPSGFESGTEFMLYTPETPVDGLSEDFLSWWPTRWLSESEGLTTLGCYGLYNVELGDGFFTSE